MKIYIILLISVVFISSLKAQSIYDTWEFFFNEYNYEHNPQGVTQYNNTLNPRDSYGLIENINGNAVINDNDFQTPNNIVGFSLLNALTLNMDIVLSKKNQYPAALNFFNGQGIDGSKSNLKMFSYNNYLEGSHDSNNPLDEITFTSTIEKNSGNFSFNNITTNFISLKLFLARNNKFIFNVNTIYAPRTMFSIDIKDYTQNPIFTLKGNNWDFKDFTLNNEILPIEITIDVTNLNFIGGRLYISSFETNQSTIHLLNNTTFLLDGLKENDWDGKTTPTDIKYISQFQNVDFYLESSSSLHIKSYLEVNNINLNNNGNNTLINITGGYLNSKGDVSTNNMHLNNGKIEALGINIYGDLSLSGSSNIIADTLSIFSSTDNVKNINIELTDFHLTTALFKVNDIITYSNNINFNFTVDTSLLLLTNNKKQFLIFQSKNEIDGINLNFNIASWFKTQEINQSENGYNLTYLQAEREKTYEQVLAENNIENTDFIYLLSQAIDLEMSDNDVSEDLAKFINLLDGTMTGENLINSLLQITPINNTHHILFANNMDNNALDMLFNNQKNQNFWLDYNISSGNILKKINSSNMLALGYNYKINSFSINFMSGFSNGKVSGDSLQSNQNGSYFAINGKYETENHYYMNLSLLKGIHSFETSRSIFTSTQEYNNNLVNLSLGKDFYTPKKEIMLKLELFASYERLNLNGYKENSNVGFVFNDKSFNGTNSGFNIEFSKEKTETSLIGISIGSQIGYKVINNLKSLNEAIFMVDNSYINLLQQSMNKNISGTYYKPTLKANFYHLDNFIITLEYENETMTDIYTNNTIKLFATYNISPK